MLFKKRISVVISLLLLITVIMPANVFAAEKENDVVPLSVLRKQYKDASIITQLSFEDGTIIIEQVNDDKTKALYTTIMPDKKERLEYYDGTKELIYTYIDGEFIDIFDIEQARKDYTIKIELTDEDEKIIDDILEIANGDIDKISKILDEKGLVGVYVEVVDGEPYIELDITYPHAEIGAGIYKIPDFDLSAANKIVYPAKKTVYQYQPTYSYRLITSQSKYHSGLGKTITSRVYQFANNYKRTSKISKIVGLGTDAVSLVQAALTCATAQSWFSGLMSFYNVAVASGSLKERIEFMSEEYYTYNGEKSGWTYDYVTPNAAGRYKGYARTYHNASTGKITLGWTGTSQRYNFHWVNSVHPKAYNVTNSTILNKAYDMYTSFIITHGYYPY